MKTFLLLISVLLVSAPQAQAHPDDWCLGAPARVAHLAAYRHAQIEGLALVHIGTEVRYSILEALNNQGVTNYEEAWRVVAFDPATGEAQVVVTKKTSTGLGNTEQRSEKAKILGDHFRYEADKPESCNDPYVFAHGYGRKTVLVAGKKISTLSREQLNVANATYSQTVSAQVPFFLVEESIQIEQPGRSFTKSTKLIDFKN